MNKVNAENSVAPSNSAFPEIKEILIGSAVAFGAVIGTGLWYGEYWHGPLRLDLIQSASPCVQEHLRSTLDEKNEPVTRSDLSAAMKACETATAAEAQRQALQGDG